ncbi:hypothetical protein HHI36_017086, partial [Cryptolaemus montrouzieri]
YQPFPYKMAIVNDLRETAAHLERTIRRPATAARPTNVPRVKATPTSASRIASCQGLTDPPQHRREQEILPECWYYSGNHYNRHCLEVQNENRETPSQLEALLSYVPLLPPLLSSADNTAPSIQVKIGSHEVTPIIDSEAMQNSVRLNKFADNRYGHRKYDSDRLQGDQFFNQL